MLNLSQVDWLVLGSYAVFLGWAAVRPKPPSDIRTYLLGARRLTLPSFVATTVSTWYGGILGVGEFSWKHGISNWLVFGVPYYLAALVFALIIAGRASRSRLMSIPDQLRLAYGEGVARTGALVVFVMTVPAAYVLMMGVLIQMLLGLPLWLGMMLAATVTAVYVYRQGFRGDLVTDRVQFLIMFGSFALVVGLLAARYGGLNYLKASLPPEHFHWRGGLSAGYIISWYFIAMAALVEPSFYQRSFATDPATAKKGFLLCIPFWVVFDFLTTTAGLFSRALLGPNLNGPEAYPLLADRVLPPGIKGLFFIGLLATIQSTVDSNAFLAGTTLGRDVLARVKLFAGRREILLSRLGLAAAGLLAVAIALWSPSVVEIWNRLGSLGTPALVLPLALSYNPRWKFRPAWALANILGASGTVGLWFLVRGQTSPPQFPFTIQPIFVGFGLSAALLVTDHLTRKERIREGFDNPLSVHS